MGSSGASADLGDVRVVPAADADSIVTRVCCSLLWWRRAGSPSREKSTQRPVAEETKKRRSTLAQDRADLRARMQTARQTIVARKLGKGGGALDSVEEEESVNMGAVYTFPGEYDWSRSTRDNFQIPPDATNVGFTPPYASIRKALDEEYHGRYTRERQSLQDLLVDHMVSVCGPPQRRPWLVFTAGAMGAGKSRTMTWLSDQGIFPLSQVVQIDPDLFKTALPEWPGYVRREALMAGYHTRQESGMLCEIAQEVAMRDSRHIWVDGSLRDGAWYASVFQRIQKEHPHYRIAIFHVTAEDSVVFDRALRRAQATGRHVPRDEIEDSLRRVPVAVELLSPHARFVATIDNTESVPCLIRWLDNGGPRRWVETAPASAPDAGAAEAAAQAGPQSPFSPPSRYSMRSDRNAEEVSSRNLGALDEAWDAIRQRFAFECDSKVKRARTLSQLLLSRRASSSGMIAVSRENLAADKPPVPARFASAGV